MSVVVDASAANSTQPGLICGSRRKLEQTLTTFQDHQNMINVACFASRCFGDSQRFDMVSYDLAFIDQNCYQEWRSRGRCTVEDIAWSLHPNEIIAKEQG